jgi:hypothetical protein
MGTARCYPSPAMQRAWHREYNPSLEAVASCGTEPRTPDDILPSASEGAILLLTPGCALAYATQHSPWTTVERACTSYAPCSHGKGACGAMLDASGGGRARTVFVARQAAGPAGVVQRGPGVHAVDGGAKEREEGRDGGVWAEGPGDRARRRRARKARTRRSVAPWTVLSCGRRRRTVQADGQRYTRSVPGGLS